MGIQSIVLSFILLIITYRLSSKFWLFLSQPFQHNKVSYNLIEVQNAEDTTNHSTLSTLLTTNNIQISNIDEDEDVKDEIERIKTTSSHVLMKTDVLVLNQVSKLYNGTFRAVDQVSFGVKKRECFGLLGVNGA